MRRVDSRRNLRNWRVCTLLKFFGSNFCVSRAFSLKKENIDATDPKVE